MLPVSRRVINGTKEVTLQCVTEDDVSRQIQEQEYHVVKDRLPFGPGKLQFNIYSMLLFLAFSQT